MPPSDQRARTSSAEAAPRPRRSRLGVALVVVGLFAIVGGVLYVLEAANGPGTGPKRFAERRSYDQVKQEVHRTFPLGLCVALAGLGLTMAGARVLGRGRAR